jgi:hypothetical protein
MPKNKQLTLKSPQEIVKMLDDPNIRDIVNYIDKLHSIILNYQIVIDQAVQKNENATYGK